MIWKNKNKTFVVKSENLIEGEFGKMVRFLPCVDFWTGDNIYCLGFSWLTRSIEFWYGDLEDLI